MGRYTTITGNDVSEANAFLEKLREKIFTTIPLLKKYSKLSDFVMNIDISNEYLLKVLEKLSSSLSLKGESIQDVISGLGKKLKDCNVKDEFFPYWYALHVSTIEKIREKEKEDDKAEERKLFSNLLEEVSILRSTLQSLQCNPNELARGIAI